MLETFQCAANGRHPIDAMVVERAAGERFYSPFRPPCSLHVLLEGRVSVARMTQSGKRLVTEVLKAGDVFGDLSFCGAENDNEFAEALTDCRTIAVYSNRVKALIASEPKLANHFLVAIARRLNGVVDRLEEFAYGTVEARVAAAVIRVAGHAGQTAPVTHQFLAEMAGTYRETATRILGDLNGKDVLRLARGAVEIKDSEALSAVAVA